MARVVRRVGGGSIAALALAALVASGCEPAAPAIAQACADVAWGGYDGEPRCAALARRTITGADRACRTDADCELVHPGASCREQAVGRARVARYRSMPAACTHPAGGPCAPVVAVCQAGCCTTDQR